MLDRTQYLVKEHVGMLKLVDAYDIFDAETGEKLAVAKEEIHPVVQLLRLVINKQMMPTTVVIRAADSNDAVLTIKRGVAFLRSKVTVADAAGSPLGYFKSKLFSIGGGFDVFNLSDQKVAEVKGDWKGWNFKFRTAAGEELGTVAKQWAGVAKELFTSADNYVIALADGTPSNRSLAALLLAAGIAIDTVYKENKS
ncbi:MAG TPA: phospholipid scramblase-related protein [Planctomycetaceae bacterium]|nr:phospholipid scramblase-related protein [Planctomycetaceae bacterium]